jgi:hypothetical protein
MKTVYANGQYVYVKSEIGVSEGFFHPYGVVNLRRIG